jgi:TonB family protein
VKEFLKLQASDTTSYLVQGVVSKVRSTTSGSFYLQDPTGTLLVYGLKDPAQPGINFGQMDIVKGDTLAVLGRFTIYGGSTLEMKDGRLIRKANGPDHNLSFYDRLERKPAFKGKEGAEGLEAFKAWVQKNLKKAADGATGTVEVRFVVGRNGGIQEVQAIKGGTPAMRAEAVRVVQSAPKWKPAISDGSPVRMPYTLEVRF